MTSINEMEINLPDLFLKNTLDSHFKYNKILTTIFTKLNEIPNIHELRNHNVDLIKLVCNLIENLIEKGNRNKINKLELAIDVFKRLFNYQPNEIEILKNIINFLWSKKHIKKISNIQLIKKYAMKLPDLFLKT